MSGGQAAQLNGQTPRFMSDIAYKAMTYAIAVNEANAKMFRIVACPTAGSCGVMPVSYTHLGGDLTEAINAGVAAGYVEGYLRKSVVAEPLFNRKNTQNNTPAIIYTEIVPGDKVDIQVELKGFGSENKSDVAMLVPADGVEGVKNAVLEIVKHAGPNPCPRCV